MQPPVPYGTSHHPVAPNAAPMHYGYGGYAAPPAPVHPSSYAQGKDVVLLRGSALPGYCVKCGQPGVKHIEKTMHWHPTWVALTILLSPLIYILVASLVRKSQPVAIPLCGHHAERRRRAALIAVGALVLGALSFGVAASGTMRGAEAPWLLLCAASPVVALVAWVVGGSLLTPVLIDERTVRMRGAGPGFLQGLPPWMWG